MHNELRDHSPEGEGIQFPLRTGDPVPRGRKLLSLSEFRTLFTNGELNTTPTTFDDIQNTFRSDFETEIPTELAERLNLPNVSFQLVSHPDAPQILWLGNETGSEKPTCSIFVVREPFHTPSGIPPLSSRLLPRFIDFAWVDRQANHLINLNFEEYHTISPMQYRGQPIKLRDFHGYNLDSANFSASSSRHQIPPEKVDTYSIDGLCRGRFLDPDTIKPLTDDDIEIEVASVGDENPWFLISSWKNPLPYHELVQRGFFCERGSADSTEFGVSNSWKVKVPTVLPVYEGRS